MASAVSAMLCTGSSPMPGAGSHVASCDTHDNPENCHCPHLTSGIQVAEPKSGSSWSSQLLLRFKIKDGVEYTATTTKTFIHRK